LSTDGGPAEVGAAPGATVEVSEGMNDGFEGGAALGGEEGVMVTGSGVGTTLGAIDGPVEYEGVTLEVDEGATFEVAEIYGNTTHYIQ
jgi:hypothetical protein